MTERDLRVVPQKDIDPVHEVVNEQDNVVQFRRGPVNFMIYEDVQGVTRLERDYRVVAKTPGELTIFPGNRFEVDDENPFGEGRGEPLSLDAEADLQ